MLQVYHLSSKKLTQLLLTFGDTVCELYNSTVAKCCSVLMLGAVCWQTQWFLMLCRAIKHTLRLKERQAKISCADHGRVYGLPMSTRTPELENPVWLTWVHGIQTANKMHLDWEPINQWVLARQIIPVCLRTMKLHEHMHDDNHNSMGQLSQSIMNKSWRYWERMLYWWDCQCNITRT